VRSWRISTWIKLGIIPVLLAAVTWGGLYVFVLRNAPPMCSWPARITGNYSAQQSGLAQCYLKALATQNLGEMRRIGPTNGPRHITSALFKYSPDLATGIASVRLEPSPVDSTVEELTIRYADGVTDSELEMNMEALGGPSTWRMDFG